MNFDEWKILAKGMRSVYSNFTNFLPDGDSVKIWFKLLEDIPYEQLNLSITVWCSTQKFPPTVADLRNKCVSIINDSEEDWSKGWELTIEAVQRYGSYQGEKGINSLPEIEREVANRIGWQNICNMDINNMNVNRAQYRDIYNSVLQRRKQNAMIPESVKLKINALFSDMERSKQKLEAVSGNQKLLEGTRRNNG